MALIGLEDAVHDGSRMQQIGEACHVYWVQHVHFEKYFIPNTVSKERHTLDQGDVPDVHGLAVIRIASVGGSKSMINRGPKGEYVCIHFHVLADTSMYGIQNIPTSFSKLPLYSKYR